VLLTLILKQTKILTYFIIKIIVNNLHIHVTDGICSMSSLSLVTEFTVRLYNAVTVFVLLGLLLRLGYGFGRASLI